VYNVHSLIHLVQECRTHGPLHCFSAFVFEAFLGELTALIKGPVLPLAQLRRRIVERNNHDLPFSQKRRGVWDSLKPNSKKDAFCILEKGVVIKVTEMDEAECKGFQLRLLRDITHAGYLELYELPNLKSSDLNIFLAKGMYMTSKSWKKADFPGAQKCLLMDYFGQFDVVIPIVTFQF
jgi:hypothetical protein